MIDKHSDYALNKFDKAAIVCPCATGENTRLVREDFSSEEEFLSWKKWSDENYHETELASRKDDCCLSFEAQQDAPMPSAEDFIFASYMADELANQRRQMLEQVRDRLTDKQYKRLYLHYIKKLSVEEIAEIEGVSSKAVYLLLAKAKRKIVNKL